MNDDKLFELEYDQVWQQRRQHVALIWAIPTIAGTVTAFYLSKLIELNEYLNPKTMGLLFLLLLIFVFSACMIFLRHNFFCQAYGYLLQEMERTRLPFYGFGPQFGDELRYRFRGLQWSFWEQIGARCYGINSWLLIMFSFGLSVLLIILDFMNLPSKVWNVFIHG